MTEVLLHKLSCDTVSVKQVTRLGAPPEEGQAAKLRPLRITLETEDARNTVLRNAKNWGMREAMFKDTRKPCYRKDDRAMHPIYKLFTVILFTAFTLTVTILCADFDSERI